MLKKEARQITGGLSAPSKMPGPSYNLPATQCITGAKLAKIPGSVCHGCYALKGRYRFNNVKAAMARRLEALGREARFLRLMDPDVIPKNLIIRFSSHMVDQQPVGWWPWTSTVSTGGKTCPAKDQGNECKSCRACWDRNVSNVTYPKH